MARDYARNRKAPARSKKAPARRDGGGPGNGLRWYLAGLISGLGLSFFAWLATLPGPTTPHAPSPGSAQPPVAASEPEPPRPRFDFYTMLPEQSIEVEDHSEPSARVRPEQAPEYYLLQAGSFKQQEDADRRRAELLLLGLEPRVEASSGDNGRWFRVYLGPFDSRSAMAKARSLTAAQDIDTLLLKRRRQ